MDMSILHKTSLPVSRMIKIKKTENLRLLERMPTQNFMLCGRECKLAYHLWNTDSVCAKAEKKVFPQCHFYFYN